MSKNQLAHFEIPAENPGLMAKFYADLFEWKFEQMPLPGMEYWMCSAEGPGISGAVMKRQNATQPCMNYVNVEGLDSMLQKAVSMGGTIALPRMEIPGKNRVIAVIIDPEGNLIGLTEETKP